MHNHPELAFFINDEVVVVHAVSLSVRELLDVGGFAPADYVLLEHNGGITEFSNLDEKVDLTEGRRFHARRKVTEFHIIVNGRERSTSGDELTFDQVIALAPNLPPPGPGVEYRVTFRAAVDPKHGDMISGESVRIKDGTEFVVSPTNRS